MSFKKKEIKASFALEDSIIADKEKNKEKYNNLINEHLDRMNVTDKSSNYNCRMIRDKNILREKANLLKKSMLSEAFANIVLEAVPIDDDKKPLLQEYIMTLGKYTYEKLMEEGKLEQGCDYYIEYIYPIVESFSDIEKNVIKGDKSSLISLLERVNIETDDFLKNEMVEPIKNKVTKVLINEQLRAKKRNDINNVSCGEKRKNKSLFEKINLMTYNNLKNGKINTLNESTDYTMVKYKFDCLEEEALVRTVIYSTILESLNTLNLCNFKQDDLNDESLSVIRSVDRM